MNGNAINRPTTTPSHSHSRRIRIVIPIPSHLIPRRIDEHNEFVVFLTYVMSIYVKSDFHRSERIV